MAIEFSQIPPVHCRRLISYDEACIESLRTITLLCIGIFAGSFPVLKGGYVNVEVKAFKESSSMDEDLDFADKLCFETLLFSP